MRPPDNAGNPDDAFRLPPLIQSDSLTVSRLYKGKADPQAVLGGLLGKPFLDYRARWERARSQTFVPPFPLHVDYEALGLCNYRCPMCPMSAMAGESDDARNPKASLAPGAADAADPSAQSGPAVLPTGGSLPLSKIRELLDEGAAKGQAAMGFGGLWEPLLLSGLPDLVAYGREKGLVDAMVNTNGSLLTSALSRDLIEAGLTRLMVSLDALSPKTYSRMRPGGELRQVEGNIMAFLSERERKKSQTPLLRVSFLVTSLNESELPGFIGRWEGVADFLSIQRYGHYEGRTHKAMFPKKPHGEAPGGLCAQPFKRLLVRHQGDLLPCCDLSGMAMPMGNVFRTGIQEVWEGTAMSRLRESLRGKGTLTSVCRSCQSKYQDVESDNDAT
ncbi:MAG: radical SAM protein [Deltaproteobacteria bacterium]|nr:radical SAM protein [Deltaproteobacteria bacterium]